MNTLNEEMTLGTIVAQRPSRSRILENYGLDYCCGGKRPLWEACDEKGLDAKGVIAEIAAADTAHEAQETDWTTHPMSELIADILATHHAYLKTELGRIQTLTQKAAAAHGSKDARLAELQNVFLGLKTEMEAHLQKEEIILFPLIERLETAQKLEPSHRGTVNNPIAVMEHEHDSAGAALSKMRALTDGYVAPEWACNTLRALLDALGELERNTHQHIHKENNILFPRAAQRESELAR